MKRSTVRLVLTAHLVAACAIATCLLGGGNGPPAGAAFAADPPATWGLVSVQVDPDKATRRAPILGAAGKEVGYDQFTLHRGGFEADLHQEDGAGKVLIDWKFVGAFTDPPAVLKAGVTLPTLTAQVTASGKEQGDFFFAASGRYEVSGLQQLSVRNSEDGKEAPGGGSASIGGGKGRVNTAKAEYVFTVPAEAPEQIEIRQIYTGHGTCALFTYKKGSAPTVPRLTAKIVSITGDVGVRHGDGDFQDAVVGQELTATDDVNTGPDSGVVIRYSDGSTMELSQLTQVGIEALYSNSRSNKVQVLLKVGEVRATVKRIETIESDFSMKTNFDSGTIRGTVFTKSYDPKTQLSVTTVQEGEVLVTPTNSALKPVIVKACQRVEVTRDTISPVQPSGPQVTPEGKGCCSRPAPDNSVSRMTLQVPEYLVNPGQQLQAPVYLLKPANVANLNWTLTYDPKVVQVEGDALKGNLVDQAQVAVNVAIPDEPGVVRGGFFQTGGLHTGTGTLAVLRLRVVGAAGTRTPLTLAATKIDDPAGTQLPIDLIDGSVGVVAVKGSGSGPGSGRVPGTGPDTPVGTGPVALDALSALKMSVKLLAVDMNYDVDGDGQVTSRDAVIIAQRRLDDLGKQQP